VIGDQEGLSILDYSTLGDSWKRTQDHVLHP